MEFEFAASLMTESPIITQLEDPLKSIAHYSTLTMGGGGQGTVKYFPGNINDSLDVSALKTGKL